MRRNPWLQLAVLAIVQFLVFLDVTIVSVALPSIQQDLGFSATGLQWVASAYALIFGGFLLLGGRLADRLGRRRVFIAGLLLFGLASLLAGIAQSPVQLIVLRGIQGLGGALLSPAAFAMVTIIFPHGRRRNIALGVWSALAGLGGIFGVVIGGLLVDQLSWQWIFLVNVPVAALVVALTFVLLDESRAAVSDRGNFDVGGAVLGTAGLLAIILGIIRTDAKGWASTEVIGLLVAGLVLLAAFGVVERRTADPLVPPSIFRSWRMTGATIALSFNGATFLAYFFMISLFLQQVRQFSALKTGVLLVPMGVTGIVGAFVASRLVSRFGTKPVQVAAALFTAGGLIVLSQADATGSYPATILPGVALYGFGVVAMLTVGQISAVADITHDEAATVSGIINTGRQVGGAIGLAVASTVSASRVEHLISSGSTLQEALVGGFERGLIVAALFGVLSALVSAMSPQVHVREEVEKDAADLALVPGAS